MKVNRHTACLVPVMAEVRFHHGGFSSRGRGGAGRLRKENEENESRRLNLLLSWGGWRDDSWVNRIPQLLEPMGVWSIQARTAQEAAHVIRSTPVHIAVVDLGLPLNKPEGAGNVEEAGPRILEMLRRLDAPPPTVVVKASSSSRDDVRHLAAALRNDAFAVVDRTAADLELMLKVLQRCMQRFYKGRWPDGEGGGMGNRLN